MAELKVRDMKPNNITKINMKSIGFTFTTNEILVCILSGTKDNPVLQDKKKISLPQNYSVSQLVEWFETELGLILDREKPLAVTFRLTITNVTNSYVSKVYYGQAILNLLCAKKNILINNTSPNSINPNKFKLAKGIILHEYIDSL